MTTHCCIAPMTTHRSNFAHKAKEQTQDHVSTPASEHHVRSEQAIGDVCTVVKPLSFTVYLTPSYDATVAIALSALNNYQLYRSSERFYWVIDPWD